MSLTAGLFNSSLFEGGLFNGGLFHTSSTVSISSLLFGSGEQGFWYDPSDFSTMYQDSAGTTPVTAVGQPVGKILDISGNNNHAYQATAASRPILRQDGVGNYYLEFDGIDDSLATNSIDFTGTDKISVFAGMYKTEGSSSIHMLYELSSNSGNNNGAFGCFAPENTARFKFYARNTINNTVLTTDPKYDSPLLAVVNHFIDFSDSSTSTFNEPYVNGEHIITAVSPTIGGSLGNYPLYIGRRNGAAYPFSGRLYGLVISGAKFDQAVRDTANGVIAEKTGVILT